MKVIFCSSYYPQYLDYFYKKRPELRSKSYAVQLDAIKKDFFGGWSSYTNHFNKMGIESELVIPNCEPLQKAWARENKVRFDRQWMFNIALKQIQSVKPDVFFISSMFDYYDHFLSEVKNMVPNVFGWISCALPATLNLKNLDLIVTSLIPFAENFRNQGKKSEVLNAAFDMDILDHLDKETENEIDFSFVGSLTGHHSKRISAVRELIKKTPFSFYGTGINNVLENRSIFKRIFPGKMPECYKGVCFGVDMFNVLKRSKITFNNHIDISNEFAGNMRMYEATGAGSMLLTDGKFSAIKPFADNEVVYYESIEDAIEKVHYFLDHESERNEIAARGQKRTFSDYNYDITSKRMYDYFKKHIK